MPECSKFCIFNLVIVPLILFCFGFSLAAAQTTVAANQLAGFNVKGIARDHLPFMKAALAQGFTPVCVFWTGLFKLQDIVHIGRLSEIVNNE